MMEPLNTSEVTQVSLTACKAATHTVMAALVRKWQAEGTLCGEEGRKSDDEGETDGDQWRERRAVYFECAEELNAALLKLCLTPNPTQP